MQCGLEKIAKVTLKKGSPVNSRNVILDINTKITELEHNKNYKYLESNEVNGIKLIIDKETNSNIEEP